MSGHVVVDASVAVKWVIREDGSDTARALLREWVSQDVTVAAPSMLLHETANALLKKVRQGSLTRTEALEQMRALQSMHIEFVEWPELHTQAMELAWDVGHPAVYDPLYLAVAEELGCELWLADGPFYGRALSAGYDVRFLEA